MAPSSKKIGEEEASNILLNYLATQNRPYAVTDIITNLHGTIGKTLAIKVLTTLAEQGKIFAKTYGKAVIYVVKQDGNAEEENSTKDLTEEENETKAKELEDTVLSLSGEIKKLKSKLKDITSEPTNDELPKLLEDLRTEVSNQNKIIGEISDPNAKQITIEEIEDLKKQKDALQKIYKKRTKVRPTYLNFFPLSVSSFLLPRLEDDIPVPIDFKKPDKMPAKASSAAKNKTESSQSFGVGYGIQPKRNLNRFVKWPAYIRLQRQKKILSLRLKVPPSIAQFQHVLDKNTAAQAFKLLNNYRPETRADKKARLEKEAAAVAEGKNKKDASEKPYTVKYGLKHVVGLIENKKPQLVLIADDVDPIELVVFLPALCRKVGVPYAIVKGKARLGTLVHKKTAAVVAITEVRAGDKAALSSLLSTIEANYTSQHEEQRKKWGGGHLGSKSVAKIEKRARIAAETLRI